MDSASLCCDMTAMSGSERKRYTELRARLEKAIEETRELENGYAFRWSSDVVSLLEVAEFVEKERKCCPFLDFKIAVERERGPIWLKITGREGVKVFLRTEFGVR
jgi:hypothetical protein